MLGLFISTILTSAADSLNPVAITQQFVLQGMVKKAKHIWYYIIAIALTNLTGGFFAYFGLISLIGDFLTKIIDKYGKVLFTTEFIVGICFIITVFYLIQNTKIDDLKRQIKLLRSEAEHSDEEETTNKIKSVSPISLIALGVVATISELTTALPYFAFLAILFNYKLSVLAVTLILIVYNIIYSLPLIIMYFVYVKAQEKFDQFYVFIKKKMTKWAVFLAPVVVGIIGILLVGHSMSYLFY